MNTSLEDGDLEGEARAVGEGGISFWKCKVIIIIPNAIRTGRCTLGKCDMGWVGRPETGMTHPFP